MMLSEDIVNFELAIQNLTDILIDDEKFADMVRNIYDAIDNEKTGTLRVDLVEKFVRDFMRGEQIEGHINTNFEPQNEEIFKKL